MWHLGYHDMHGYESETMMGRDIGTMQWLYPYIGFDYHYKKDGGPKIFLVTKIKIGLASPVIKITAKQLWQAWHTLCLCYLWPMQEWMLMANFVFSYAGKIYP